MSGGRRVRADDLLQDPEALRELLRDPRGWLVRHGLSEDDVACPEDAHAAEGRAAEVAAKANELASLPLVEALPRLHELACAVWGEEVELLRIPFGVVLAERPVPPAPILDDNPFATTGTGTISCTFRLRCKADVDR